MQTFYIYIYRSFNNVIGGRLYISIQKNYFFQVFLVSSLNHKRKLIKKLDTIQ